MADRDEPGIVCVIVSYDAARDPLPAVDAALGHVRHVILVDNAEVARDFDRAKRPRLTVLANGNRGALAGAYNLALAEIDAHLAHASHVLFLDDDSEVGALPDFLAHAATREACFRGDVAAVAPVYIERETGLRLAPIRLRRFTYRLLPRDVAGPVDVSFLINSMSLWRRQALLRIGPYDEGLGVDHVDTDYCLRAASLGYRLVLNTATPFAHSIGRRRMYRLFGKTLQSGGHAPARRRMIARNTVAVARRHALAWPSFVALCLVRLAYEALGIVLAERDRREKLWAMARGVVDALRGRTG
ncbi:MAG: glycosyltransferase [Burkholderiales bacterium]|nr:glycosyltransferase [Burkholderiales bacterium]